MHGTLAPGARVVIRDEEWLLRRVDPSSDGGVWISALPEDSFAACFRRIGSTTFALPPASSPGRFA